MRLVFLLALALPYARAPLCELGSRGHEEHAEMDHHEAGLVLIGPVLTGVADGAPDCHVVMGCRVGAELVVGLIAAAAAPAPGLRGASAEAGQGWLEVLMPPELPPPRTI